MNSGAMRISSLAGKREAISHPRPSVSSSVRSSCPCPMNRDSNSAAKHQVLALEIRERRLADDRHEPSKVASPCVGGVELVGQVPVVLARLAAADPHVHQPRQARQRVDRRVDAPPVQVAAQHDLALGDVAGEVRNRVRHVVVRHRQDRAAA